MRRYKFTRGEIRERQRHRRWRRTALLLSGLLLLSAVVLTVGHARRAPSAVAQPAATPKLSVPAVKGSAPSPTPTPRAMDEKALLDG